MPSNITVVYKTRTGNIETTLKKEEDVDSNEKWYHVDTYFVKETEDDDGKHEDHDYINNTGSESDYKDALIAYINDLDCFQNGAGDIKAEKELASL